jgi:hypothetical protein
MKIRFYLEPPEDYQAKRQKHFMMIANFSILKTESIRNIELERLYWVGHLTRASENRMLSKGFNAKPEGTRKMGRPLLTREEYVWQGIRIMCVRS